MVPRDFKISGLFVGVSIQMVMVCSAIWGLRSPHISLGFPEYNHFFKPSPVLGRVIHKLSVADILHSLILVSIQLGPSMALACCGTIIPTVKVVYYAY